MHTRSMLLLSSDFSNGKASLMNTVPSRLSAFVVDTAGVGMGATVQVKCKGDS